MKRFMTVFLALIVFGASSVYAFDDIVGDVYEKEIADLKEWGFIEGYDDGKFHPEDLLTRAEATQVIVKILHPEHETLELDDDCNIFSDLNETHWAYKAICILVEDGIVNGFEDGTFCPDDNLTHAQVINMCLKMTGYHRVVDSETIPWYSGVVSTAKKYGFMEGTGVSGDEYASRKWFAKVLYNTINMPVAQLIGWTTNKLTGIPTAEIEIADGSDGREYITLRTQYNSYINKENVTGETK